jgi:hypothetical protein
VDRFKYWPKLHTARCRFEWAHLSLAFESWLLSHAEPGSGNTIVAEVTTGYPLTPLKRLAIVSHGSLQFSLQLLYAGGIKQRMYQMGG